MKCKILIENMLQLQEIPLEDQINNFLANNSYKIEDVKLVPALQSIYAFIFYTENSYLKGDNNNV